MIFNFYLPDEIIVNLFGPVISTTEEKEEVENAFYMMFLDKLCQNFQGNVQLMKYLGKGEIHEKVIKSNEFTKKIVNLAYKRRQEKERGDNENNNEG